MINFNKKISSLIKIINEQDTYIKSLETEFNVSKYELLGHKGKLQEKNCMSSDSKNEFEIISGKNATQTDDFNNNIWNEQDSNSDLNKNKNKDDQILAYRKQLKEDHSQIMHLTHENTSVKKKYNDFDEVIQKAAKIDCQLEEVKIYWKNQIKNLNSTLEEKDIELANREEEIRDIGMLLKRSDEKRIYSNEYNIFMETNNAKLKDKLAKLQQEKAKAEKELEELKININEKEIHAEELKVILLEVEAALEHEKTKNSLISVNLETAKETLKASNEKNEMLKLRYKVEKEKNQRAIEHHKTIRQKISPDQSKRRSTVVEQVHLAEINKEETQRCQQKYISLISEINITKEMLEKLYKTEIFLKNSILTKDLIIAQIQSMIKMNEENEENFEPKLKSNPIKAKNMAELVTLMEEMKYRYKSTEEVIKCVSCFKVPSECYLASPCGHLSCLNCKSEFEVICPQCSKQIDAMVHAIHLDKIISNLRKEVENVDKAKKLLEHSNF